MLEKETSDEEETNIDWFYIKNRVFYIVNMDYCAFSFIEWKIKTVLKVDSFVQLI